jgi:hypothetical protein
MVLVFLRCHSEGQYNELEEKEEFENGMDERLVWGEQVRRYI